MDDKDRAARTILDAMIAETHRDTIDACRLVLAMFAEKPEADEELTAENKKLREYATSRKHSIAMLEGSLAKAHRASLAMEVKLKAENAELRGALDITKAEAVTLRAEYAKASELARATIARMKTLAPELDAYRAAEKQLLDPENDLVSFQPKDIPTGPDHPNLWDHYNAAMRAKEATVEALARITDEWQETTKQGERLLADNERLSAELDAYRAAEEKARAIEPVDIGALLSDFEEASDAAYDMHKFRESIAPDKLTEAGQAKRKALADTLKDAEKAIITAFQGIATPRAAPVEPEGTMRYFVWEQNVTVFPADCTAGIYFSSYDKDDSWKDDDLNDLAYCENCGTETDLAGAEAALAGKTKSLAELRRLAGVAANADEPEGPYYRVVNQIADWLKANIPARDGRTMPTDIAEATIALLEKWQPSEPGSRASEAYRLVMEWWCGPVSQVEAREALWDFCRAEVGRGVAVEQGTVAAVLTASAANDLADRQEEAGEAAAVAKHVEGDIREPKPGESFCIDGELTRPDNPACEGERLRGGLSRTCGDCTDIRQAPDEPADWPPEAEPSHAGVDPGSPKGSYTVTTTIEIEPTEPERQPGDVWCEKYPKKAIRPDDEACKAKLGHDLPGKDPKARGLQPQILRCKHCLECKTEPEPPTDAVRWTIPPENTYSVKVYIEKDKEDDEAYNAEVPRLPGCCSYGYTIDKAKANITEALTGCLESYLADGEEIPWLPLEETPPCPPGATERVVTVKVEPPADAEEPATEPDIMCSGRMLGLIEAAVGVECADAHVYTKERRALVISIANLEANQLSPISELGTSLVAAVDALPVRLRAVATDAAQLLVAAGDPSLAMRLLVSVRGEVIDRDATCGVCCELCLIGDPPDGRRNYCEMRDVGKTSVSIACVNFRQREPEPKEEPKARFFRGKIKRRLRRSIWVMLSDKTGDGCLFFGEDISIQPACLSADSYAQDADIDEITYDQAIAELAKADWPEGKEKLEELIGGKSDD